MTSSLRVFAAAECNGLYERSDDYGWRNEAPVYIRRRAGAIARERSARPVSYTHLTLPTKA